MVALQGFEPSQRVLSTTVDIRNKYPLGMESLIWESILLSSVARKERESKMSRFCKELALQLGHTKAS